MPAFGSFALLVALALSGYNLLAGAVALRQLATGARGAIAPERLAETARRAGIASFFAVACAAFALVWAAFTNDFSVAYITEHSNRALPAAYKFAALWSGQEGSLLLWAFLLAAYGFVLRLRHKVDVKLFAYASTILAGVQVFFLLLVNVAATPFSLVTGAIPPDGNGLNPLLQYPEMVIHPPMLYLGYVGFSVPFAFALGALIMRYPGEKWIHVTRRWTMVTWLFLTVGIFLGMHWAYEVLGWGGYWGWDPVENASLMPWLTGTAFLHSVMMQEKRGMMKSWNVWLIFSTFMLSILGTLLTRSGLVSSVHAFAQSSIGTWFWVFLVIVLAVCTFVYILNRDHLRTEHKLESLVSRESSFAFNNLVLLAACFTVLWGTLFPVLSEYVQGNRVTVSAPFYNRVAVPIGVFLLLLTGMGPLLAWRSTSMRSIRRNFVLPGIVALIVAVGLIPLGVHPWTIFTTDHEGAFYAWMTFSLAGFVITAIFAEFYRGGQRHPAEIPSKPFCFDGAAHPPQHPALRRLHRPLRRRPHLHRDQRPGVQSEHRAHHELQAELQPRPLPGRMPRLLPGFESQLRHRIRDAQRLSWRPPCHEARARTSLLRRSQQPSTIVANHSTLAWDLYVIYAGKDPSTGQPVIKAFLNPLVSWIWIGVLVTVFGTLIALLPNLSAAIAAQRHRVPAEAEAEAVPAEGQASDAPNHSIDPSSAAHGPRRLHHGRR